MWKKYGELLCESSEPSEYIDSVIVQAIDADDNGIEIFATTVDGVRFQTLPDIIESFVPRYVNNDDNVQKGFDCALKFATSYMRRQIKLARELFEVALPDIRNAIKDEDSAIDFFTQRAALGKGQTVILWFKYFPNHSNFSFTFSVCIK